MTCSWPLPFPFPLTRLGEGRGGDLRLKKLDMDLPLSGMLLYMPHGVLASISLGDIALDL
jgi:hypothetical protein